MGRPFEVAVASINEVVRLEWAVVFGNAALPSGLPVHLRTITGKSLLDARNGAVAGAIEREVEYLMFWDDDVVPRRQDALIQLYSAMVANPEISIIGGVYPRRKYAAPEPIVMHEKDGGAWWGWQDGEVHPVYMTGTGFTILRLADFAGLKLPAHILESGEVIPQVFGAEDWAKADGKVRGRITDDCWLADVCEANDLIWAVHGGVVCRQIDLHGQVYDIEDARPAKLAEATA